MSRDPESAEVPGPPRSSAAARLRPWALALLAAWACDGGCSACGQDPLGELTRASGEVERDHASGVGSWRAAAVGATFELGDGVKTGAASEAVVTLTAGGGVQLVPDTIVRFLASRPDDPGRQLAVERGEVELTAGETSLSILGAFGAAVLEPGGRMRVGAGEGQISFEVLIGSARIERDGEEDLELELGVEIVLDIELGEPIIEDEDVPDAGAPDAGPVDAGPVDAGELELEGEEITIRIRGVVEQMTAAGAWERVDRRASALRSGTRVRIGRGARLSLERGEERLSVSGQAEAVVGGGGGLAQLVSGRADLDAGSVDVAVAVPGGVVVGRAQSGGTRLDVRMRGEDAAVTVQRGAAELRGRDGDTFVLRAGAPGTLLGSGSIDAASRPPARAHVAIEAGSSATIHDPQVPVAVRITFGSICPGEGVVELASGARFSRPSMRSFGAGAANVAVHVGSTRYRVRCATAGTPAEAVAAQGTLSVRRDSGRQTLPRRPPRNVVDTDGRRYTVLYQNLLPIVTVRWGTAPAASGYTLRFEPEGAPPRVLSASSASVTLESGDVPEGSHRLSFQAAGSSARSPATTLTVRFDNAAPSAFIREPVPGTEIAGSVRVSGAAVDGATVSVGGTELPLDRAFRFAGTATLTEGLDALAIKIVHPRSGVHYYLRRVTGR